MDVVCGLAALFGNEGNTEDRELYIEAPYSVTYNLSTNVIDEVYYVNGKATHARYELIYKGDGTSVVTGIKSYETGVIIPISILEGDDGDAGV